VVFILVIAAGFGYLYRTLVSKREAFLEWSADRYRAVVASPYVKRFINRHPALVGFIRERLSPGTYLGLHLTVGLAISGVFIWILGGITEDILTGGSFSIS